MQVYTDQKTKDYEAAFAAACGPMFPASWKTDGFKRPLMVTLGFGMPRPKSLRGEKPHTKRPDVDNLAKAVLDAMNGIAYHDDSQITQLNVVKAYTGLPHITVQIIALDG